MVDRIPRPGPGPAVSTPVAEASASSARPAHAGAQPIAHRTRLRTQRAADEASRHRHPLPVAEAPATFSGFTQLPVELRAAVIKAAAHGAGPRDQLRLMHTSTEFADLLRPTHDQAIVRVAVARLSLANGSFDGRRPSYVTGRDIERLMTGEHQRFGVGLLELPAAQQLLPLAELVDKVLALGVEDEDTQDVAETLARYLPPPMDGMENAPGDALDWAREHFAVITQDVRSTHHRDDLRLQEDFLESLHPTDGASGAELSSIKRSRERDGASLAHFGQTCFRRRPRASTAWSRSRTRRSRTSAVPSRTTCSGGRR